MEKNTSRALVIHSLFGCIRIFTTFYCGRETTRKFSTHSVNVRKKCVKLKSCSVGWVFSVRFGNVEKNAFANSAATKSYCIFTRSAAVREREKTNRKTKPNKTKSSNALEFSSQFGKTNNEKEKKRRKKQHRYRIGTATSFCICRWSSRVGTVLTLLLQTKTESSGWSQ